MCQQTLAAEPQILMPDKIFFNTIRSQLHYKVSVINATYNFVYSLIHSVLKTFQQRNIFKISHIDLPKKLTNFILHKMANALISDWSPNNNEHFCLSSVHAKFIINEHFFFSNRVLCYLQSVPWYKRDRIRKIILANRKVSWFHLGRPERNCS